VAKVKNVGANEYVSGEFHAHPGEVVDVAETHAAYLLSDECPGKFEAVKANKDK